MNHTEKRFNETNFHLQMTDDCDETELNQEESWVAYYRNEKRKSLLNWLLTETAQTV